MTWGSVNDESPRLGGRSYDPLACEHGCCPLAVCVWEACDHTPVDAERYLAELYDGYRSAS